MSEGRADRLACFLIPVGLSDYLNVDILDFWYKFVNFRRRTRYDLVNFRAKRARTREAPKNGDPKQTRNLTFKTGGFGGLGEGGADRLACFLIPVGLS